MTSEIEAHRGAAKALKKAYLAGEPAARERVRAFVDKLEIRHADILHVIAREAGHSSWPKLKHSLELNTLSRDERAERLKIALHRGWAWMIDEMLAQDPTLPAHNLGLQIALYDVDAVNSALERDRNAATRIIGIRSPILHLAFSRYHKQAPERAGDIIAIAERLVAAGADVNDGYPFEPGSEHLLSALYGALAHANNIPLARWLLEHGASPDDNESLYHSTELGHTEGLKLLLEFNAKTSGTNALPRAIDFNDPEMVRLLLEAGANPDEAVLDHPSGEAMDTIPGLHQAARRWASAEIATLLLDHGANPRGLWHGHTPYATARIFGNAEIAALLESRGLATSLDPL
ncbi:MAG: ankyrin repeat domain-containing protein [Pseudomonadota bacterium]